MCIRDSLIAEAQKRGKNISDIVIEEQAEACETTEEKMYERMLNSFKIMQMSIENGMEKDTRSAVSYTHLLW